MYCDYDIYKIFKSVENIEKGKTTKILDYDGYLKRVSEDSRDALRQAANLFNTRFSNINLKDYIECGFYHFKSFNYDKMFRDIVLNEYIARDTRKKRDPSESMSKVMEDLKYIDRSLESYIQEVNGSMRVIIYDYILNNIGSTIVTYCIWRNLFHPDDGDWVYMSAIKNNYPAFEKNVTKFAGLIDKWRASMKAKR